MFTAGSDIETKAASRTGMWLGKHREFCVLLKLADPGRCRLGVVEMTVALSRPL